MVSGQGTAMAAKVYKMHTGSTFAGTAIDGGKTWVLNKSADHSRVRSDGDVAARFGYLDGIRASISVTCFDDLSSMTLKLGSLVLKGYLQDEGLKAASPTVVTLTATKAILVSSSESAVTEGETPTTYNFELHSTDGTEAGLYTMS